MAGPPGRDAQFELWMWAVAKAAGLRPVIAEPDVVCSCRGARFGLACKRIKSRKGIEGNVREAAGQIRDAHMPGAIALELTTTAGQHPGITYSNDIEATRREIWSQWEHFKREEAPRLARLINRSYCYGLVYYAWSVVVPSDPNTKQAPLFIGMSFSWAFVDQKDPGWHLWDSAVKALMAGDPQDPNARAEAAPSRAPRTAVPPGLRSPLKA